MERGTDRHATHSKPFIQQSPDRGVQHLGRGRDNRLSRCVRVRDQRRDLQLFERFSRGPLIGRDGRHAAGVSLRNVVQHQTAPGRQSQQTRPREAAGRRQRHRFAVAVAGNQGRSEAEALQNVQREQVHRTQCVLGDAGVGQHVVLGLLLLLVHRGPGEDPVGQPTRYQIRQHRVGFFEHRGTEGSILSELLEHAGVLCALAREQETDRGRVDRYVVAQVDARAILDATLLRE